jgi:hypothetical protein
MSDNRQIDFDDAMRIADFILGIDNPDESNDITADALHSEFSLDAYDFHSIVIKLFKAIDFNVSELTDTPYVGFSTGNFWLAKKPVEQQFIRGIIQWATEGEKIPEGKKGFVRSIFANKKHEYDITISIPKKIQENDTKSLFCALCLNELPENHFEGKPRHKSEHCPNCGNDFLAAQWIAKPITEEQMKKIKAIVDTQD